MAPVPSPPAAPAAAPPEPNPSAIAAGDLTGKLKWYYARLFPNQLFTRWLRYGSDETLSKREISFTLPGDIYIRWQSFDSPDLLLKELCKLTPIKIDVGAIYNFPPAQKNSNTGQLTPMEKELVFDIDMTDYEDVMPNESPSASAVDVCDRNWAYMATAVRVMDAALREDFGFQHMLWVYSGRRGIHCWVADRRARLLNNEQRSAVADYLHLRFEGRENAGRRQGDVTVPLHPSLARAKRVCDRTFRDAALGSQGVLDGEQRVRDLVANVPNRGVADALAARVGGGDATERWGRLEREIGKAGRSDYAVRASADYIVLRYTYPRLDVGVSREINHLLKAPFCVHPKTGRVCVPFRADEAEEFLPGAHAPEVGRLLAEMREVDGEVRCEGAAAELLKNGVRVLEEFVQGVEGEARRDARVEKLGEVDRRQAKELLGQ